MMDDARPVRVLQLETQDEGPFSIYHVIHVIYHGILVMHHEIQVQ
jgi:hypothetical protein